MTRPKVVSAPTPGGAHPHAAEPGDRGREDPIAWPNVNRQRFAGDGRLVERRLPTEHVAVNRRLVAGAHDNRFAGSYIGRRHDDFRAVAFDARRLWRERGEVFERPPGSVRW